MGREQRYLCAPILEGSEHALSNGTGRVGAHGGRADGVEAPAPERRSPAPEAGATALLGWGLAGGLGPALQAGTICLPSMVVSRDGATFATDLHWREILTAAISPRLIVVSGKLLTSAAAIEDVAAKAAAFGETGAVAVDMESAGVAEIAAL